MADDPLEVGQIGTGMIVDGVEDTPWISGTLTYLADEGVRLEVPFIGSLPGATDAAGQQFGHVRDWFNPDNPRPPHNLVVEMQGRVVSLYDCRWTSTSGGLFGGLSFGSVAAENVISGRQQHANGEFAEPLTVRQVRSRLDGLARLTRFSSVKRSTTYNDDKRTIRSARVDVESGESLTWQQDDATMTIASTWTVGGPPNRLVIEDDVVLTSEFPTSRPIADHLAEHRKVQRLLTVLVGRKMNFRSHEIRDLAFAETYPDDFVHSRFHPLINRWTHQEHRTPAPEDKHLARALLPIVNASSSLSVGAGGLERWSQNQSTWERIVLPLVGRLDRTGSIEDRVITAGLCLEAAGHLIGPVEGERNTWGRNRPSTTTYVFRVLADLGIVFAGPAPTARALARAIAGNYNDLKHYDRGTLPDPAHTYLVSRIATLLLRSYLAKLVLNRPEEDEDAEPFASTFEVAHRLDEIRWDFDNYGLRVNADGNFESRSGDAEA